MTKVWERWYECSCHTEGIMIGYDYEENGIPLVDLAFFSNGMNYNKYHLSLWDKIRWCLKILKTGVPYQDMITIDQENAGELGKDLLAFSKKKYKGVKNGKKKGI
jgi:hypothetical protein